MPRIFLSYRRDDAAGHAGRLYDSLAERFGEANVFMDVDAIHLGADFHETIDRAVASSDVMISVIGREWVTAADASGRRRLDDPHDFVRLEVESAIKRDVTVIPACVERATMPSAHDLPPSLAALARRQGIELRDVAWPDDVQRLIRQIEDLGRTAGAARRRVESGTFARRAARSLRHPRAWKTAAPVAGVAVAGVAIVLSHPWSGSHPARPIVTLGVPQISDAMPYDSYATLRGWSTKSMPKKDRLTIGVKVDYRVNVTGARLHTRFGTRMTLLKRSANSVVAGKPFVGDGFYTTQDPDQRTLHEFIPLRQTGWYKLVIDVPQQSGSASYDSAESRWFRFVQPVAGTP
jgi:TIR domain